MQYRPDDEVDFVVVGSGAAGGVVAKELSTAGFRVVVLEQGPWRTEKDFVHDEIKVFNQNLLTNDCATSRRTRFARRRRKRRSVQPAVMYGRGVGGTSVHFSANFWRFREIDFKEASVKGPIAGTGFADWPITYQDLEPYYTKVDWEVGVAGAPGPFDPPRSRPYPMPPHPPKSTGVLLETRRGESSAGSRSPRRWPSRRSLYKGAVGLRAVRILPRVRLRGAREIELARVGDPGRGRDGPLRDPAELATCERSKRTRAAASRA